MILIIDICKEKLHYYEFVKPIGNILSQNNFEGFIVHYDSLTKEDLEEADKIIICGTSLKDDYFFDDIDKFSWIKKSGKPILGICGGMQIIGLLFGGEIKEKNEIGYYNEDFKKEFLGISGKNQVYHLHNNYIDFEELNEFDVYSVGNEIIQAVKHKNKEIYGCLFHPEVRNKKIIVNFIKG